MDHYIIALHICSKLLQDAPDQAFLTEIRNGGLFSAWPLEPVSSEAQEALAELAQVYGGVENGGEDLTLNDAALAAEAQLLHQEHLLLFSGPNPLAPPWESVWREKERLLFGEQTMLVRRRYNEWGLEVVDAGHSPEDHLGLELAFAVHLLQAHAASIANAAGFEPVANGDHAAEPDRKALDALTDFLDEHILQWAEPCLRQVARSATLPFYRGLGPLCLDALLALREELETMK